MEALKRQVEETVDRLAARWGRPLAILAVRRLIDEACGRRRRMMGEPRRAVRRREVRRSGA